MQSGQLALQLRVALLQLVPPLLQRHFSGPEQPAVGEGGVQDHLLRHFVRVGNVWHAGLKLVKRQFKFVATLALHMVVNLARLVVLLLQAFLFPPSYAGLDHASLAHYSGGRSLFG